MPIHNTDIAEIFNRLADILEIQGANPFRIDDLNHMRFGVWQARRGWLESDDVLNTKSWKELKKLFKR
ncbi:MAG: PHP domain-containing protein [Desulfobacterales bacterium]|nr:PHP domain-containing protein [Desulfobacterales bacterium]